MYIVQQIQTYIVHCTANLMYIVQQIQCTLYIVQQIQCTLYSKFNVHCTSNSMCIVHCTANSMYIVHCTANSMYIVHCKLAGTIIFISQAVICVWMCCYFWRINANILFLMIYLLKYTMFVGHFVQCILFFSQRLSSVQCIVYIVHCIIHIHILKHEYHIYIVHRMSYIACV